MPMIIATYLKWRIRANFINGSGAVPPIVCRPAMSGGARLVACIFLLFAGGEPNVRPSTFLYFKRLQWLAEPVAKAALSQRVAYAESAVASVTGAARKQTERPSTVHSSLYLPEPVYEALRKIAFEERLKIHDVVLEGIDLALRRRGYPSIEGLKAGKNGSSTKVATFRC